MDGWLGVELRHLVTLAAVHEARSFRGAARQLGYVQSAVSQQIANLESHVGVRLIERARGKSGVELTEAGRVLLSHSERILSHLDAAQADLRSLEDGNRETLRVGMYQGLPSGLLARSLALLAEGAPEFRLDTREELCDIELFGLVERGEVDLAFAELPLAPGPFDYRALLVDPLVLLVPADSELAEIGHPPELAEIATQPLICDPTWRMLKLIEAEFRVAGLELKSTYTSHTSAGAQALVAAGLGVAVVPHLAADLHDPKVRAIPLDHLLPVQTVVCFWHRDRELGERLTTLLQMLATVAEELSSTASGNGSSRNGANLASTRRIKRPEKAASPGKGSTQRHTPA